jgi:hypothetical protein
MCPDPLRKNLILIQVASSKGSAPEMIRTQSLSSVKSKSTGKNTVNHTSDVVTVECYCRMLIPQVRLAHKYPISPWEMIHPPGGDNPVCI